VVQCDSDGIFIGKEFRDLVEKNGKLLRYTTPHRHEYSGQVERMNRTLMDKARSILSHSKLNKTKYLPFALTTAAVLFNRTPSVKQKVTPFEARYGNVPDVSFIRVFGCKVLIVNNVKYPKQKDRAREGILLGFPVYQYSFGIYTVLDLTTNAIIHTRDVYFYESKTVLDKLDETYDECSSEEESIKLHVVENNSNENLPNNVSEAVENKQDQNDEIELDTDTHVEAQDEIQQPVIRRSRRIADPEYKSNYSKELFTRDDEIGGKPNEPTYLSQYKQQVINTVIRKEGDERTNDSIKEPRNVKEALKSHLWREAMVKEFETLVNKGTFKRIRWKTGIKVIRTKWVYRYKIHEARAKARLCVLGFMQDVSEEETYAPTANHASIKLIIVVAVWFGFELESMDVDAAFLNAQAPEGVYIHPPEGFEDPGYVLELVRSLYGMATSPRAWYLHLKTTLEKFGLEAGRADPCFFKKQDKLYVLIYVDDILFTGNRDEMDEFKRFLSGEYDLKAPGNVKQFCGIAIRQEGERILLNQEAYIKELVKRFGVEKTRKVNVPMTKIPEKAGTATQDQAIARTTPYRELIGSLMFLSTQTRPDITFSLGILSRFNNNFNEEHWKAAKKVLRYLNETSQYNLSGKRVETGNELVMTCYSDSDWAGAPDRKSISGCIILVNDVPLVWYSKKQTLVALSSTEAELISLCECVKRKNYLKQLLLEYGFKIKEPVVIHGDNQAALLIAKHGVMMRTKHMDLRKFYIKDEIDNGLIQLDYVPTEDNIADLLTKPLGIQILERMCRQLFQYN